LAQGKEYHAGRVPKLETGKARQPRGGGGGSEGNTYQAFASGCLAVILDVQLAYEKVVKKTLDKAEAAEKDAAKK